MLCALPSARMAGISRVKGIPVLVDAERNSAYCNFSRMHAYGSNAAWAGSSCQVGTRQSNRVSHLPDLPVADKLKQADVPQELTIHNLGSPTPNSHRKIECSLICFALLCYLSTISYRISGSSMCILPPCSSRTFLVLQLSFLKKNYWQWERTEVNTILVIMGGRSPVQTHVRSQSLDLDPKTRAKRIMDPQLEAAIPTKPMTQGIIVATPVMDMEADTTMLRLVLEDERTAKVHVYQTPLVSALGKELRYSNFGEGIGAIDNLRGNQHSNVNMTSLLHT